MPIASDIITNRARHHLADTEPDYRYTDTLLMRYLTDTMRMLKQKRPDIFLKADGTIIDVVDITDLTDDLLIETDAYNEAIADYLTYLAFWDDEETQNTQQALQRRQAFEAAI